MSHTPLHHPSGQHAQTVPIQLFWVLEVPAASCALRLSFWQGGAW